MKKLTLFALFFVLDAQLYGHTLVYNLHGSAKGVNNSVSSSTIFRGYLIINTKFDELLNVRMIWYGRDSCKNKVFVYRSFGLREGIEQKNATLWNHGDSAFFSFYFYEAPCSFEGFIFGKASMKDVGLAEKEEVVRSMKGNLFFFGNMFFNSNDDFSGISSFSSSFNAVATKLANQNNLDDDQIDGYLLGLLAKKGYVKAVNP